MSYKIGVRSFARQIKNRQPFIKDYHPEHKLAPKHHLPVVSAWKGLELILDDHFNRFNIKRNRCIEFGVEFGYSAVAFSSFFDEVIGVDTFEGDCHTDHKGDHYEETKERLSIYPNIKLIKSDYRDFIKSDHGRFDFAHVDIVHNYKETYECGLWTAKHTDLVVFHDTESFPEVRKAVIDIAKTTGSKLYNYPLHSGLGIVVTPTALKRQAEKSRTVELVAS